MNEDALIKNTDIQRIAEQGSAIYKKIKGYYDPKEIGKFLAIDVDSEDTYLASSSAEALALAQSEHPNTVFYVVKVGFDTVETMAKSFL